DREAYHSSVKPVETSPLRSWNRRAGPLHVTSATDGAAWAGAPGTTRVSPVTIAATTTVNGRRHLAPRCLPIEGSFLRTGREAARPRGRRPPTRRLRGVSPCRGRRSTPR